MERLIYLLSIFFLFSCSTKSRDSLIQEYLYNTVNDYKSIEVVSVVEDSAFVLGIYKDPNEGIFTKNSDLWLRGVEEDMSAVIADIESDLENGELSPSEADELKKEWTPEFYNFATVYTYREKNELGATVINKKTFYFDDKDKKIIKVE